MKGVLNLTNPWSFEQKILGKGDKGMSTGMSFSSSFLYTNTSFLERGSVSYVKNMDSGVR